MIIIKKIDELNGHKAGIYALSAADSNYIYSGGVDKHIIKWDLKNSENSEVIIKTSETIYSLYHHLENNLLFVGTTSGKIHIIDLLQKKEIKLLQTHSNKIFDFKLHQSFLIALSADGWMSFTNIATLKTEYIYKIANETIRSIDIKNDIAALACGDSTIKLFDLEKKCVIHSFIAHEKRCNVVKYHPTQNLLLSGGWDAHLNIWDDNYQLIKSIPAHNYAIYSLVFSPDNTLFATGSRDKSIKIWDALNIDHPKSITSENEKGHAFSVNKLIWQTHCGNLISASDDRKLMIWDIKKTHPL